MGLRFIHFVAIVFLCACAGQKSHHSLIPSDRISDRLGVEDYEFSYNVDTSYVLYYIKDFAALTMNVKFSVYDVASDSLSKVNRVRNGIVQWHDRNTLMVTGNEGNDDSQALGFYDVRTGYFFEE